MFKKYNIVVFILAFSFLAVLTAAQADTGPFHQTRSVREPREAREPRDVLSIFCDRMSGRFFDLSFCRDEHAEPAVFCGDGMVNQSVEECDGQDGIVDGFHCTDQCLLEADEPAEPAVADQIVINEVYSDVDAAKGEEGTNEWIELYNAGESSVNLLDWQIEDASQSVDVIKDDVDLGPGEFALISPDASTFDVFWSTKIPEGTHLIVLDDSRIGNGLGNKGDALFLRNFHGIQDAMSYGDNLSVFDQPGAGDGHSLTRSPNGHDTDLASDWLELDEPTPGF